MLTDDAEQRLNTLITWSLALVLLVSVISTAYAAVTPSSTVDPYTEFYIVGEDGKTNYYPTNVTAGELSNLTVGITNNEHEDKTYTILVRTKEHILDNREVTVGDGSTWEGEASFVIQNSGEYRLDILLYQGSVVHQNQEPYRKLRLWITVET